jgi:hypothetical protein
MVGSDGTGLRLGATAAVALLAATALGFGLVRVLPPRSTQDQAPIVATPLPAATLPDSPPPLKPLPVAEVPRRPLKPLPAVKPAPEPVEAEEAPTVLGMEPAEPRAGDSLTVRLGGMKGRGTYEFRTGPTKDWQPAPDGRVRLKDLKPGPLKLEIRSVGRSGKPSPVGTRDFNIPPVRAVLRPEPGLREGDEFFQEVLVSRRSRYSVLRTEVGQDVQYAFVSRLTIAKKVPDGTLKVRQKVDAVRLAEADKALQGQLNELLQKTKGATFHFTLNPHREVTQFEGPKETPKVLQEANPLGGRTFLLWSFLDQDCWKELAEVSFFRPREPHRKGDRWVRPMVHNWGPLGSWHGQVGFVHVGKQAGQERYDYLLDLTYRSPAPGAGAAALPFQIIRADFRAHTARGAIAYDANRGRVSAAEERFGVKGVLGVTALGLEGNVEMDEVQLFQLRPHDRNPLDK